MWTKAAPEAPINTEDTTHPASSSGSSDSSDDSVSEVELPRKLSSSKKDDATVASSSDSSEDKPLARPAKRKRANSEEDTASDHSEPSEASDSDPFGGEIRPRPPMRRADTLTEESSSKDSDASGPHEYDSEQHTDDINDPDDVDILG